MSRHPFFDSALSCAPAALLAVSALGCGAEPLPSSDGSSGLLITGVSIIRPEEGTVTEPRDVLIDGGKVVEIGAPGSIAPDRVDRVLGGQGLYALPGLIDAHTHLGDGGLGMQTDADRAAAMTQFLRYGVTSTLNLGGGGGTEEELATWKEKCRTRELDCPDVYGTGVLITAPGSHPIGTLWNLPPDTDPDVIYRRGAVALEEEGSVAPLLDRKVAMGVDAIKIIIEDWDPEDPLPRLSKAKVAELSRAAHARGLRVFAHVSRSEHIDDALSGGVDGVVHSAEDRIPDAVLASMAEQRMFYVPTLALYDGFIDRARGIVGHAHEPFALTGSSRRALDSLSAFGFSPSTAEEADGLRETLFDNLRRAAAAGVSLALGTDVNNPSVFPGYSAHEELELMVEAGLTPAQALVAATVGGASLLGRESTLGRIEPGYEADLLILRRSPLEDILNTRTLHSVIHDGRLLEDVVATQPVEEGL